MPITVGFWNIQRATSVTNANSSARAGFMVSTVEQWARGAPGITPFDILILCEAAQNSGSVIGQLNALKDAAGNRLPFQAQYIPVLDKDGNASPCSFIVVNNTVTARLTAQPQPTGGSTKRPAIIVDVQGLTVCASHIVANANKAPDEIATLATEMARVGQRCLIIGDMNCQVNSIPGEEQAYIARVGFSSVAPGLNATFKGGAVLDYAWRNQTTAPPVAVPPEPLYSDWETIDHAPIAYLV